VWPQIRAGLIALALVIGLIDGCPLPPPDDTPAWERGLVDVVRPIQRAVLTPVAWIGRELRVTQRWALFQVADPSRFRMSIEGLVRPAGPARPGEASTTWQVLYRAGDDDHRDDAGVLEYRRVRGAWNPTDRLMGQFAPFATWLALRIAAAHPDLVAIRIRYERIAIGAGEAVPTGQFVWTTERAVRR
jgi:hypothetical protein